MCQGTRAGQHSPTSAARTVADSFPSNFLGLPAYYLHEPGEEIASRGAAVDCGGCGPIGTRRPSGPTACNGEAPGNDRPRPGGTRCRVASTRGAATSW